MNLGSRSIFGSFFIEVLLQNVPPPTSGRSSKGPRVPYIDTQSGWRYLFFSLSIGCILGLCFRLYFSPDRVQGWVNEVLARRGENTFALKFSRAELRLAKGAVPVFAIVLSDVKIAPNPKCRPEPSIEIAELSVPFRLRSFATGKLAIGTVAAADSIVDLDGAKEHCETPASVTGAPTTQASTESQSPGVAQDTTASSEVRPWWTQEQYDKVKAIIDGVELQRVELQFENKTKRIFLDSFDAEFESRGRLAVSTELRVPTEVSYGERVPPFAIEAVVSGTKADIDLSADVDEGELVAQADLTPTASGTPNIDLNIAVNDLPLSFLIPILKKSQIVAQDFKPKFLWFDCGVKVSGPFQGLFEASPVNLKGCAVKGEGMRLDIPAAVRRPDGTWEPFRVDLKQVDVAKLLRTLDVEGPSGIASDFGRLTGTVEIRAEDNARFNGRLQGARLLFSSRNIRAEQHVPQIEVHFDFIDNEFKGAVDRVVMENGEFAGSLDFVLDKNLNDGRVNAKIDTLIFDPGIQELLLGGTLGEMSGAGKAELQGGKLQKLETSLNVSTTQGKEVRFEKAEIKTKFHRGSSFAVGFETPAVELNRSSSVYESLKPIFFDRQVGEGDWLMLDKLSFDANIPDGGGMRWSEGRATLDRGRIVLTSEGAMSREKKLFGWVEVDYPLVKKLRWALGGSTETPVLTDNSVTLHQLRKRVTIDEAALGLKK